MTFSIDQFRLENKVAIVTGAGGRGNSIGRAYALGLAEAGASLMEMMGGRALKGVRRLPCSLVIRDSCGARAGGAPKEENNHE